MSKEPLRVPAVACELGNLYIKEEIVKYLLKSTNNSLLSHIRKLKVRTPSIDALWLTFKK